VATTVDLNEIQVFVKVAQTGSFTHAAQELQMPNSTVSARVSSLEKRLGVTLIQRTTRKLNLTPAGRAYFESCLKGLEQIAGAESEVVAGQGEPSGRLRLTTPANVASAMMPDLMTKFMQQYPKIEVELILVDRRVDLIAEGVDLAIRAGELKDSSLIAKKLGVSYFATFASPAYVKKMGQPREPKDLAEHQCIQYVSLGREKWEMSNGKTRLSVPMKQKLVVDDLHMAKALAMSGNGIALLPTFVCGPEAKNGKLMRILPDWASNSHPVSFVYPAQRFVSSKVQAFISFATEPLKLRFAELEI
jgi:DNA-binding transcriptional LysR family regulator